MEQMMLKKARKKIKIVQQIFSRCLAFTNEECGMIPICGEFREQ